MPGRPEAALPPRELAGPAPENSPLQPTERIASLDVLRGVALMGILFVNINGFALPKFDHAFPLTTVRPVFSGPHWHLNTALWFARWIFAEGKMRALFSMLFGAGGVLLTRRAENRGTGLWAADLYTRRNLWLVALGLAHCYLIWNGDILFFYGTIALLFLFPLRRLQPKTLIVIALLLILFDGIVTPSMRYDIVTLRREHAAAQQAYTRVASQRPLSPEQQTAIARWESRESQLIPSRQSLEMQITDHQKGYLSTRLADRAGSFAWETTSFVPLLPDVLEMMLLGMALIGNGFLSNQLRSRTYALTALLGLGFAWPTVAWTTWFAWSAHFELWHRVPLWYGYQFTRAAGATGTAAAVLLLIRSRVLPRTTRAVAAVGQMALSNYLLTSLLLQTIFVWSPLHWFGYLAYYQMYAVVPCMWTVNLVWSTLWLRHFRFGPVEWLWRSLTYWTPQPMRLKPS